MKSNFAGADRQTILEAMIRLPIQTWNLELRQAGGVGGFERAGAAGRSREQGAGSRGRGVVEVERGKGRAAAVSGVGGAPLALVVSAGLPRMQFIDNTTSTTQQREESHCGVIGYHSRWLAVRPESDGMLVVDTPGATYTVVLALYGSGRLGDAALACAVGEPVRIPGVTGGRVYYLAVDGLDGASGPVAVECRLGQEPRPESTPPVRQAVALGDSVLLLAPESVPGPVPSYQWLRNGVPLSGAIGRDLMVSPRSPTEAGIYGVVIDNGIGRVTNEIARLVVQVPLGLSEAEEDLARFEGGEFVFGLRGNALQQVGIEQSEDLLDWRQSARMWLSGEGKGQYRDGNAGAAVTRMYRAIEVPVHVEADGEVLKGGRLHQAFRVVGGQVGQRYVVEQSADAGATLTSVHTNTVQTADWHFEVPSDSALAHRLRALVE